MTATLLATVSGRMVDLLNPRAEDIDFGDIAEQLAKENRYNGATPDTCYSVAEHLSRGALQVYEATGGSDLAAAWFLVHDFPEAYLKDDTTPKKRAIAAVATAEFGVLAGAVIASFDRLTERFDRAIAAAAGLAWPPPDDIAALVHTFDRIMLNTEWRDLMRCPHPWPILPGEEPLHGLRIAPWGWQRAAAQLREDCRRWLPACKAEHDRQLAAILAEAKAEMTSRHSWSAPTRFLRKSERVCVRCGLVKVTRHENGRHWVEWWRDGERVASARTPACVVAQHEVAALGIDAGLAWGTVAEATVVYTDRGISPGMEYGINRAAAEGRPVEYRLLYR